MSPDGFMERVMEIEHNTQPIDKKQILSVFPMG